MIAKTFILGIILLSSFFSSCEETYSNGYNIDITINGAQDTTILIAYHFGDKKYIKDTLETDNLGHAVFTGEERLPGGIYLVVMPDMDYFEIMIDREQEFSLVTSMENPLEDMKIEGSGENELFVDYQLFMNKSQTESASLRERLNKNRDNPDSLSILREKMDEVDNRVMSYWENLINEHPDSFISTLVKAMKQPEIPEIEVPPDAENPDSVRWTMRYNYNRENYFDNIDFSDSRLLRTPVLHNRLNNFFNRFLQQHPNSIIPEADRVVELAKADEEVYQYVLVYLLNNFERSSVMGLDEVFVHLAEKYYLSGQAPWASDDMLKRLRDRVERIKPNLIGRKAKDMRMIKSDGSEISLHQVDAEYIIIYFYEPECSFCKQVTPELAKLQSEYSNRGVEVFGVYILGDTTEWNSYISENDLDNWINVYDPQHNSNFRFNYDIHSVPTLYLLDRDKVITAKQVGIDTLRNILEEELK